jgi:hypothetical protein
MEVKSAIAKHVDEQSVVHAAAAPVYKGLWSVAGHEAVAHSKMYVRDGNCGKIHTNIAEGYFSLFKRGLFGTYQHISERHLPRYLAEFDFRQSNCVRLGIDAAACAARILKGAEGKRLIYQQPC